MTERTNRKQLSDPTGANKQCYEADGRLIIVATSAPCNLFRTAREYARSRCKFTSQIALRALVLILILNLAATALKPANCSPLKVVVAIPELVRLNDSFWLECSHNSHSRGLFANQQQQHNNNSKPPDEAAFKQIYSIKWYKDEEEFYSFLPKGDPRVSYYDTKGVQPDKTKSFEGNVLLTKADLHSEGTYRCEILSEGPVFETVRKSKHLKVFAPPVKSPRIEVLDSRGLPKTMGSGVEMSYDENERIVLRCNAPPSKPPARLRWFVNDREVPMPGDRQGRPMAAGQSFGHMNTNANVTPTEHRVHYMSIQSAHSTLSLAIDRQELHNGRISFKCLAVVRQSVPISSKQLILLTPQQITTGLSPAASNRVRIARELLIGGDPSEPEVESTRGHGRQRHRAQYNSRARMQDAAPPLRGALNVNGQAVASRRASTISSDSELISSLAEDSSNQMMYIYEDADTTYGPSVIDSPETLAAYLSSRSNDTHHATVAEHSNYLALDASRADNLDQIQQIRERLSRQRSFPTGGNHKRLHGGHHSLVKSPLYLDENDALRPVINWPPLESGRLIVLPPSQTLVAVPSSGSSSQQQQQQQRSSEMKFVMPPRGEAPSAYRADETNQGSPAEMSRLILERLIDNLNCTCSETYADTKLKWLVNDKELSGQDVRHYPARVAPDHKQTWLTIGLQPVGESSRESANSLSSILAQYHRVAEAQARSAHGQAAALRSMPSGRQQVPVGNEQLRFVCQAQQSMLLYSSSESITFDFSQPDGDKQDKLSSLPTNVIQAAGSSTRSGVSSISFVLTGSHKVIALICVMSSVYIMSRLTTQLK